MPTELPITNLIEPIQTETSRFTSVKMDCLNPESSDSIAVRTVSFGGKNSTACPKPTSFIAFANLDYCNLIKQFFDNLMNMFGFFCC